MLIQSGGGNVYAVLANNEDFELSVLPQLSVISTTVFLQVRCRYKSLKTEYFDPLLVPKRVLVGGIERSQNTLRGTVMLSTGFTLEKVGSGFPTIVSKRLFEAAVGFLIADDTNFFGECLTAKNLRSDFITDFSQLVTSAIAPISPAKDFSDAPALLTAFDLAQYSETAGVISPKSGFQALPGGAGQEPVGEDDEPFSGPTGPGGNVTGLSAYKPKENSEKQGVD